MATATKMKKARIRKPTKAEHTRWPKAKTVVDARYCSSVHMVGGAEHEIEAVIDYGTLKDWVGFGWVDLRKATKDDYDKYPVVVREDD